MKQRFLQWLAPASFIFLITSCQKQELQNAGEQELSSASKKSSDLSGTKTNTFYGPQVHVGNGKVRSWTRITHAGIPEEMGIEMTAGALTGLPMEHDHPTPDHTTMIIPIHQKGKGLTPFDHIGLNWNPQGHPPAMFFLAPHFDIHFYMMSVEERMAIPAYSPASAAMFNNFPDYMPANYFAPPGPDGAEIQMGKHWAPPPPTFLPFTRVMILGTYNGKLNFVEPMVTLAYLQSKATSSQGYSQPTYFEHTGKWYPTVMNVYAANGKHYVSLSSFVKR